jgi:large subunit ribosomal protein L1
MEWIKAIETAKVNSKPRKFVQSWDLIINLKGIDLKKPENRFSTDFILPEGKGKPNKIAVIADSLVKDAKECGADFVIKKEEIESFAEKKKLKSLAENYDLFLAEAPLMATIGKSWGTVLGPRGKMPKPITSKNLKQLIDSARHSVRIVLKENPTISVTIGRQDMESDKIAKNAEAVYNFVKDRLPKGPANIKSVIIKLTMGKPVKVV